MEAEVVCVNSYGRKGSLGILESDTSTLITLPLEVIHMLLSKDCPLLTTLGKKIQYEVAIGLNGKVSSIPILKKCSQCLSIATLSAQSHPCNEWSHAWGTCCSDGYINCCIPFRCGWMVVTLERQCRSAQLLTPVRSWRLTKFVTCVKGLLEAKSCFSEGATIIIGIVAILDSPGLSS